MRVLVIDTAGQTCSVMLWHAGRVIAQQTDTMMRGHAAALAPMVEGVLAVAGCTAQDCDRFAVTTGPGSFTGLRVGLSMTRGLALAVDRPAIGINRFQAWAATVCADFGSAEAPLEKVLVALDSRRGTAFVQEWAAHGQSALSTAIELSLADAEQKVHECLAAEATAVCGDAACLPRQGVRILDLAAVAALATGQPTESAPHPFYLRPPDAKPMAV